MALLRLLGIKGEIVNFLSIVAKNYFLGNAIINKFSLDSNINPCYNHSGAVLLKLAYSSMTAKEMEERLHCIVMFKLLQ